MNKFFVGALPLVFWSVSGFGSECALRERLCLANGGLPEPCEIERAFCEEDEHKIFRKVAECRTQDSYYGGFELSLAANSTGLALLTISRYAGPDGDGGNIDEATFKGLRKQTDDTGTRYIFGKYTVVLGLDGNESTLDGEYLVCK